MYNIILTRNSVEVDFGCHPFGVERIKYHLNVGQSNRPGPFLKFLTLPQNLKYIILLRYDSVGKASENFNVLHHFLFFFFRIREKCI